MEVYIAASTVGKRRFFIDLSNWDRVGRLHKPFLINSGWPQGLTPSAVDIGKYIGEVEEIYREASGAVRAAEKDFVKAVSKLWPLRFILPMRLENVDFFRDARVYWEVKTHLENVLGKRFDMWSEVYAGWAAVEVKNGAVYIGGVPSIGHTYLKMINALSL